MHEAIATVDPYLNNLKILPTLLLMLFPTCSLEALVLGRLGRVGLHFAGESNLTQSGSLLWAFHPTQLMESVFSAALG